MFLKGQDGLQSLAPSWGVWVCSHSSATRKPKALPNTLEPWLPLCTPPRPDGKDGVALVRFVGGSKTLSVVRCSFGSRSPNALHEFAVA